MGLNAKRVVHLAVSYASKLRKVCVFLAIIVALSSGCSKEARKDRYLANAARDFNAENYDRAEIEYLSVLRLSQGDATAIARLGIIYQKQAKLSQASTYLRKAVELAPGNLEVRLNLGLLYATIHAVKEARTEAMSVLEKQPWNEDALLLLVDCASDASEIEHIRLLVHGYQQRDKDCAAYHLALGALGLRQQNFEHAELELKQSMTMDSKSAAVQLVYGNLCLLKNDLSGAEHAFKTSAELSPWHSAKRLTYADFKFKTGNPGQGRAVVEEITRKVPDYLPAWLFLAQNAAAANRFEECDSHVERIFARDPANYEALLLKSNILISQGDATNAITHLERVRSIYSTDPAVCAQLAVAHLMNLDIPKARACLNQALSVNPNFADAILLLAELDIRQGKAHSAIAAMQKLAQQQPELARAHVLLAEAYVGQKDYRSAIAVYRHMMELFPENADVPLLLGLRFVEQEQMADARQAFEKSLELAPQSISALEQLVNLDLAEKQYAAASARVKLRLEKTPRSGNPWLLFAKIHLAQGEIEQAEGALLRAISLEPDLRTPYILLADIYRNSNKSELALQNLNSLLARNSNDIGALLQVATIQTALTNYPAARDAYERVLLINPKSGAALNNLACLYAEQIGRLDKAYELACKGRRLYPRDPFTADTLGWILYKQGNYLQSLGSLQESVRFLSAEPEVQYHLGMASYMMGDEDAARTTLQRAVQSTNQFTGRADALHGLAVLAIDPRTADAPTIQNLDNVIGSSQADVMALCRRASIYECQGRFSDAASTYEKAVARSPQNTHAIARLALIYGIHMSELPKAVKLAKEAHNLTPDDPSISYALGRLLYLADDQKWAANLISDAATKRPDDPDLQYDLALSHYAIGDSEKARMAAQQAVHTPYSFARLEGAKLFLELLLAAENFGNQSSEALGKAERVLKDDPKNLPASLISALAHEQQSDFEKARQTYEDILRRAPLFAPACKRLADLYSQHFGDDKKAIQLASRVREILPDDPEVARTLGILTYRTGKDNSDFVRSAQLLRESSATRDNDPELFYYLGLAEYQAKALNASKQALERALALKLEAKFADDARRLLAKMN
jgi:tetratricopeptide (TPR) repeat protein